TYEVAAELGGTTTTTGYEVIEASPVPGEAGLYVTFVATRAPGSATARFQPALPLKVVELPIVPSATFTTAGTDPASQVAVSWRSTVTTKTRVDACGTPLDAYRVQLSDGRAVGPALDVTFTAAYAIGTQYGGLSLADELVVQGNEGDDTVSRRIKSTVSAEPGGRA
ncbi:MAG TPA: hypothetical protein VM030_01010, partial [Acidimicrobiales bacterium]|nr:hypothetical protein [Acidimicrobiales bacterium]